MKDEKYDRRKKRIQGRLKKVYNKSLYTLNKVYKRIVRLLKGLMRGQGNTRYIYTIGAIILLLMIFLIFRNMFSSTRNVCDRARVAQYAQFAECANFAKFAKRTH